MRETRVNLKHLLEDIRDSYNIPIEEAIITELVANALDSGADTISFSTHPLQNSLTILDNGKGMLKKELANYHNIAATTKARGRGIGFAGVGAKLSLLISNHVITETKNKRGGCCATHWHLAKTNRAPWEFITPTNMVFSEHGTAVIIHVADPKSLLTSEEFLRQTIIHHFYPLLDRRFFEIILRFLYKKPITFFINGKEVLLPPDIPLIPAKMFRVFFGKSQKIAGFGYIIKDVNPFARPGLAISTYGKIIKSGWEWVGITPKNADEIFGIVEIPQLAEILTINKNDFLRDATSLKKYYQYRKSIQQSISPILAQFSGEPALETGPKTFTPLTKEIRRTLGFLAHDFPELVPLFGLKKSSQTSNQFLPGSQEIDVSIITENKEIETQVSLTDNIGKEQTVKKTPNSSNKKALAKNSPGLVISFEEHKDKNSLARIVDNTIWINKKHPAYAKSQLQHFEEYHILFCVAWTLSKFLGEQKSPQEFMSNFLSLWAEGKKL